MSEREVLAAALLWARNHIALVADGRHPPDRAMLDRVVERLDRVLENREPTVADMRAFHDFYAETRAQEDQP